MALWNRIEAFIFGGAVARAGSEAVTPVLEPVRQKAWKKNTVRVLGLDRLAGLVAHGFGTPAQFEDEANRSGFDVSRLEAAAALEQTYPGLGDLDTLSNRELLTPELVNKALSRHGIPGEYHGAILASFLDILTPGELAAAIHRGLVPDPVNPSTGEALLRGEQPQPPFNVEPYPVYPIDALKEAAGSGYDPDRLGVLVGLQGLPMGVIEAAHAFYRGIITHGDYIRAFNESNSRNEWAKAVLEYARQIPTARDFFENALRGYHELDWAQEQAKRHGMSPEDSLVIYQNQGRPLNIRQITQALARGAQFHPEPGERTDPYEASFWEGNLKPGYHDLALALRYTAPTPFAIRLLAQAGVWDAEKAATRLKWLGWNPADADEVGKAWATSKGAAAKEATATDLLTRWDGGKATTPDTLAALEALGYPADEAQAKMDVLEARRVAGTKNTTIGDIHTDFKKGKLSILATTAALEALEISPDGAAAMVANWTAYLTAAGIAPAA